MSSGLSKGPEAAKKEEPGVQTAQRPSAISQELVQGLRVSLEARLGEAPMTVEELMALKAGSVVTLETGLADHLDLYLNGTLVARGEIVAVGDKFGVRIVEIGPS